MIERLLEADRLLALGMDAQAERIYWQAAEVDPRNAIAIVGLARVASERGDDRTALQFAQKALEVDPENPAAIRLSARLAEILAHREMTAAAGTTPGPEATPQAAAAAPVTPGSGAASPLPAPAAPAPPSTESRTTPRQGFLRRLIGGR